ncbi:MAG TPA: PPOX class F420-dependent oxidoreductase, partial [Actinomycetales bacterium]|nr:PPOX class F420-dependent oxidoreductase [Actinomycetales bacterium]
MAGLNDAARALIESGALGHLVTINPDGSPHVTVVWVGVDGDELVTGHLDAGQRKLQNIRRDPRVALSFEGTTSNDIGMRHFLVVQGRARITEGGGADLLGRLAHTYIAPGTT